MAAISTESRKLVQDFENALSLLKDGTTRPEALSPDETVTENLIVSHSRKSLGSSGSGRKERHNSSGPSTQKMPPR